MGRPSEEQKQAAAREAARASSDAPGAPSDETRAPKRHPRTRPAVDPGERPVLPESVADDPLFTADEVSAWLRKPKNSLYRWNRDGYGPTVIKVGNDLRYPLSGVLAFLEQNTVRRSA